MRSNSVFTIISIVLVIIGAIIFLDSSNLFRLNQGSPTLGISISASPGFIGPEYRTKTADCVSAKSLPDKECTPGAVFPNVTKEQVCTVGYSKSVRSVSTQTKNEVYAEYGITSHKTGEYEVDHLISLELGGSNDISNLWPESAEPRPGFHEKDQVENYLHDQVCSGNITLEQAQQAIAGNWVYVYQNIKR